PPGCEEQGWNAPHFFPARSAALRRLLRRLVSIARMSRAGDLYQDGVGRRIDGDPIESATQQAQQFHLARAVRGDGLEAFTAALCGERRRASEVRDEDVDLFDRTRQHQLVLAVQRQPSNAGLLDDVRLERI